MELVVARVYAVLAETDLERILAGRNGQDVEHGLAVELADAEGRLEHAARMYAAGDLGDAEWAIIRAGARDRADRARAQLRALEPATLTLPTTNVIRAKWEELPLNQQRAVIDVVVRRVVVNRAPLPRVRGLIRTV